MLPGIGADDKIVLWGGGVYNWFDPLTLIASVARVREDVPDVRLVFMGMKHPNPGVPQMAMADEARALADTKYSYEAYLMRTRQALAHLTGDATPQVAGGVA